MVPFLVDMARLFELFVFEWLRVKLPVHMVLKAQERVSFGEEGNLSIKIDLVLYDAEKHEVRCVMDTKYKKPAYAPESSDFNQAVTYATAKGCREAILIYPAHLAKPFDYPCGPIRVRSLAFDLSGDLDEAGSQLMEEILTH
jgi:5-methylcytosine-specific restriction enzyme subunit McrC